MRDAFHACFSWCAEEALDGKTGGNFFPPVAAIRISYLRNFYSYTFSAALNTFVSYFTLPRSVLRLSSYSSAISSLEV